jgi:hypothetical protein
MPSVFISYSNKDRAFVERLALDLKAKGLRVWYDQWELKVGDSLIGKIGTGIKAHDYLVVVLSRSSVRSEWVRKELSAALMRELQEKRVVVLPVLIEDCEIPPLISDKVFADFRGDYRSGLNKLLGGFPGTVFASGVDMPTRRNLGSNVYLDNVITTNVSERIVSSGGE